MPGRPPSERGPAGPDDDLDFGDGGDDAPLPEVTDSGEDAFELGTPAGDPPVAVVSDDDATSDLSGLDPGDAADNELAVLDWTCDAVILELGVRLRATLDTSRARSVWFTDRGDIPGALTVAIGAVRGPVRLLVERGDAEHLVLGRDFLADRVLVRS